MSNNKTLNILMTSLMLCLSMSFYVKAEDRSVLAEVNWNQLSDKEQNLLKRFKEKWNVIPEPRKKRLLKGVKRWQGMNKDEKMKRKKRK